VSSGSAEPGADDYKKTPVHQGLGFSGAVVPSSERATAAVSSGVRAAVIPRVSGCGALRRATDDVDPMADRQEPTVLPNRTSGGGGGFLGCASSGESRRHAPRRWRPLASPFRDDVDLP
jgi:hypothetical protein